MFNISEFSDNLICREGIYFSEQTSVINYPETGNDACMLLKNSSFWFNHRNRCIVELVKIFSPNMVFVDIGGGNGFVTKGLLDEGIECVLMEPGIQGIRNASSRGIKNLVCSTFKDANLKQDSIESAGIFDVLEHLDDDEDFVTDIVRAMKPGGYLYITVPAYSILWSYEDVSAMHCRRYTLSALRAKLKRTGLTPVYETYIFGFLPLPIFLFRTLPYLLSIQTEKEKGLEKNEHTPSSQVSGIVDFFLRRELSRIKRKKTLTLGGSCLVVAKK